MPQFYYISLAGPKSGGKSGLLLRANEDIFHEKLPSTIGFDYVQLTDQKLGGELQEELRISDWTGDVTYQHHLMNSLDLVHVLGLVVDLHKWGTATNEQLEQDKKQLNELMSTFLKKDSTVEDPSKNRIIYLIGTQQDKAIAAGDDVLRQGYERFLEYACANAEKIASTNVIITSANKIDSSKTVEHPGIKPAILSPLDIFKKIRQDLIKAKIIAENYADHPVNTPPSLPLILLVFLIGWISRIFGFFIGAALGAIFGLIIHNPVTCVLAAARSPDWAEWSLANVFRVYVFAPVINPLVAAFYGLQDGAIFGGNNGVTELHHIPKNMAEPFKLRTIITGTFLSILIGAAMVAVVFPIMHIALPILIGVAAAGALLGVVGYESFDFFKTHSELEEFLQKNKRTEPLPQHTEPSLYTNVKIIELPPTQNTLANKHNNPVLMQVNDYERENMAGSLLSWLQLPFKPTALPNQIRASTYEVIKP
jgi:hypothetical protein